MDWYIVSEPNEPLVQYLIQLPEKSDGERVAYTAIDLRQILANKQFNPIQGWLVKVHINNEFLNQVSFVVKKNNYHENYVATNSSRRIDVGV